MMRYRVEFSDEAKQDIDNSFEWGRKEWGTAAVTTWYRRLRSQVRDILTQFPLSQSVAPESQDVDREIRHLNFGRYRVLLRLAAERLEFFMSREPFRDLTWKLRIWE